MEAWKKWNILHEKKSDFRIHKNWDRFMFTIWNARFLPTPAFSALSWSIFNSLKSGAETTLLMPDDPEEEELGRLLFSLFTFPPKSDLCFAEDISVSPSSLFHFTPTVFEWTCPPCESVSSSGDWRCADKSVKNERQNEEVMKMRVPHAENEW